MYSKRVLLQFTKTSTESGSFAVKLSEDLHNIESISLDSLQITGTSAITAMCIDLGIAGLSYETVTNDTTKRGFIVLLAGNTTVFEHPETRQFDDMSTAGGSTIKNLKVTFTNLTPAATPTDVPFTGISLILRFNRRPDGPAIYRPMKADDATNTMVTSERAGDRAVGHRFR